MKVFLAPLLLVATSLAFIGCESDMPPEPRAQTAPQKLERGITGKGTLTERDMSEDPFVKETKNSPY